MSEATKHTPGPWETEPEPWDEYEVFVDDAHGNLIAAVSGDDKDVAVRDANARLIWAAPDLLEACQAIVALRDAHRTLLDTLEADHPTLFKAIDRAEAAIAKAAGQGVAR